MTIAPEVPRKAVGLPTRLLVVWCPDWPAVAAAAAGAVALTRPAAVFLASRVVACTAVARSRGVRRGMRRREAEAKCPELAVFGVDDGRDARLFENVARAVEELVVGLEVVRPGLIAVPVAGAAGYFGGEQRLAEKLVDQVAAVAGVECQIGVAEGLFGATVAARQGEFVPAGGTREFLAPLPVAELDQPDADRKELVDLLTRLGLRTLGAFAALTERDVMSRFALDGVLAHRLARGLSERPPLRRKPPADLTLTETFDPVLERVDVAAFLAKNLGARFHAALAARGLACTRLGIYATTEDGEQLGRVWRCAEPLTPQGVADRVRWQFEGWLRADRRLTSGVARLRLEPEETVEGKSLQLGLWHGGNRSEDDELTTERAARAFVRVQGLLGPEGVVTPILDGGRDPAGRVRLIPWGDPREPDAPPDAPWPGRLPAPSPATVLDQPVPVQVVDEQGVAVGVTSRKQLTAPPCRLSVAGGPARTVLDWAGPWPVAVSRRTAAPPQARLQLLLAPTERDEADEAVLVLCSGTETPVWTVEGIYD
ncbi:MAG TPA: DNA polymerase Y family protein [Amycolatopsis sp.]|nr:DNA polymerase Y family protein [Amycolatopsis sp.]